MSQATIETPRSLDERFRQLEEVLDYFVYAPTDILVDLADTNMPLMETTMLWGELNFRRSDHKRYYDPDPNSLVDDMVIEAAREKLETRIRRYHHGNN